MICENAVTSRARSGLWAPASFVTQVVSVGVLFPFSFFQFSFLHFSTIKLIRVECFLLNLDFMTSFLFRICVKFLFQHDSSNY